MIKTWCITTCALTLLVVAGCNKHSAFTAPISGKVKPGDKVDSLHGVYVYYNGSISHVEGRNLAPDGYNLGLKYQCVEFVKRYYYYHYKHKMPDSYGHAKDFFDRTVKDGALNKKRNLQQFTNPSKHLPQVGDLVIMDATTFNEYGHVCIVSKVTEDEVEIIQQNPGPMAPSRDTYSLTKTEEGKYLFGSDYILGWLRKK